AHHEKKCYRAHHKPPRTFLSVLVVIDPVLLRELLIQLIEVIGITQNIIDVKTYHHWIGENVFNMHDDFYSLVVQNKLMHCFKTKTALTRNTLVVNKHFFFTTKSRYFNAYRVLAQIKIANTTGFTIIHECFS